MVASMPGFNSSGSMRILTVSGATEKRQKTQKKTTQKGQKIIIIQIVGGWMERRGESGEQHLFILSNRHMEMCVRTYGGVEISDPLKGGVVAVCCH